MLQHVPPARYQIQNGEQIAWEAYLCINRKCRLPTFRRNNSTNSILLALRGNLLDVRHWVLEFLLRWAESRGLGDGVRSDALGWLAGTIGLPAPLNGGQVERC
jgi:hypothetical protein